MSRIILISIGSSGDVHPMLGIATKLQQRGHEVIVITSPHFQSLITQLGLAFRPVGTAEEFQAVCEDPDIWHPIRGFKLLARWAILHTMEPIYAHLSELYRPGETVVAAPITAFGARIAQEKLGIPLATIHLQPVVFRSVQAPPYLPPMLTGRGTPKWLIRLQFYLADWLLADRVLAKTTNRFRATLGLPPIDRFLDRWCHSPQRVIGMFPSWFAPPQLDWPPQTELTGFPLWDESDIIELPEHVDAFLQRGTPPLIFTPGSAMQHGRDFFNIAIETCQQLKRRGILLTRHAAQIPQHLPEDVLHCDYIPFSQLLPRSAALIHHGGIGSTAQAFLAGIPQLIMAMAYDQPDNAARVSRLGTGTGLRTSQFRTRKVVPLLKSLLTSQEVATNCRRMSEQMQNQQPLDDTAIILERLLGTDRQQVETPA